MQGGIMAKRSIIVVLIWILLAVATEPVTGRPELQKLSVCVHNYMIMSKEQIKDFHLYPEGQKILSLRNWRGYLGTEKISEDQLFATAGLMDNANEAKHYRTMRSTLMIGSNVLMWGGLMTLCIAGLAAITEGEPLSAAGYVGLASIGVGTSIGIIGVIQYGPKRKFPALLAIEAATTYNKRME
jgi:hypothetical protein